MTEACFLCDTDFNSIKNKTDVIDLGNKLLSLGAKKAIITSVKIDDKLYNFYITNDKFYFYKIKQYKKSYSGCGDVFSSIICGEHLNNTSDINALKKASKFLNKSIKYSIDIDRDSKFGVCYEKFLRNL